MKPPATIPANWLLDFGVTILILQQHVVFDLPERLAAAMAVLSLEPGSSELPSLIRASLHRAVEQAGGLPHPASWGPDKTAAWYSLIRPLGQPGPRSDDELRERLAEITSVTGTDWSHVQARAP